MNLSRRTKIALFATLALIAGLAAVWPDQEYLQNCENLKARFEKDTSDKAVVKRLNDERYAWEASY
ncbi:MAG: hypothetical protein SFV20_12340 [Sphingopyxis sp.]|nr:hypothetical protein [Sphingopyxis sp.]